MKEVLVILLGCLIASSAIEVNAKGLADAANYGAGEKGNTQDDDADSGTSNKIDTSKALTTDDLSTRYGSSGLNKQTKEQTEENRQSGSNMSNPLTMVENGERACLDASVRAINNKIGGTIEKIVFSRPLRQENYLGDGTLFATVLGATYKTYSGTYQIIISCDGKLDKKDGKYYFRFHFNDD